MNLVTCLVLDDDLGNGRTVPWKESTQINTYRIKIIATRESQAKVLSSQRRLAACLKPMSCWGHGNLTDEVDEGINRVAHRRQGVLVAKDTNS